MVHYKAQKVRLMMVGLVMMVGYVVGCATPGPHYGPWSIETGPTNGGRYHSVAAGDFDADGKMDIAGGNAEPGGIQVWFGNGDGSWRVGDNPTELGDVRDLVAADVNEDGYDDLICTSWGDAKGIRVFFRSKGDGTSVWFMQQQYKDFLEKFPDAEEVLRPLIRNIGDKVYIEVGNISDDQKEKLGIRAFNAIKKSWKEGISPIEAGSYEGLTVGDLNNDGHVDIVAANSSSVQEGGIQVWFGDGRGKWTEQYGPDAADIYKDVAVADFNNDGAMDIVATSWGVHGGVRVWLGNCRAGWAKVQSPALKGDFWGVTAADFNNDGNVDIAAGGDLTGIFTWLGDGHGRWSRAGRPIKEGSWWGIASADLNEDGDMDLLAGSFDFHGFKVWLGKGNGRWTEPSSGFPKLDVYYGVIPADFTNDGRIDLAAAHYSQGVHVWVQTDEFGLPALPCRTVETPSPPPPAKRAMPQKKEEVEQREFLIYFDTAKDDLRPESIVTLNEVVELFRTYPQSTALIEGYADIRDIHTSQFPSNIELSQARAQAALRYLVAHGVPASALTAVGYGDARPAALGMTEGAWQKNRRVRIAVTLKRSKVSVGPSTEAESTLRGAQSPVPFVGAGSSLERSVEPVRSTVSMVHASMDQTASIQRTAPTLQAPVEDVERTGTSVMQQASGMLAMEVEGDTSRTEESAPSLERQEEGVQGVLGEHAEKFEKQIETVTRQVRGIRDALGDLRLGLTSWPEKERGEAFEVTENKVFKTVDGVPEYKIGPKDVIAITLWTGLEEEKYEIEVQMDGTISFGYIIRMQINGLTPSELRERITEKIQGYVKDPNVTVEVVEYKSKFAAIVGEIRDTLRQPTGPGRYNLEGKIRIVEFISKYGGPTANADLTRVQVVRAGGETIYVNVFKAMFQGDMKENIILDAGDQIYIPRIGLGGRNVYVLGEVNRPGVFQMRESMHVLEAITQAGHFTENAYLDKVLVVRGELEKPEVVEVNVKDIITKGDRSEDILLESGDIVYVPRSFIGDVNYLVRQITPALSLLWWTRF